MHNLVNTFVVVISGLAKTVSSIVVKIIRYINLSVRTILGVEKKQHDLTPIIVLLYALLVIIGFTILLNSVIPL